MLSGWFHVEHHASDVVELASEGGVIVSLSSAEAMMRHLEHVVDANSRVRLTAIDSLSSGVRLHIVDSLLSLPEVEAAPPGRGADIGTGGGYPGVPLALASGRGFTLFDSVQKKVAAVDEYLETEGLSGQLSTVGLRAELAAPDPVHRSAYSLVVARALSALPSLIELAVPLLMTGGHFVAMKGRLTEEELERGDKAAELMGMRRLTVRHYTLPGGDESRSVVSYERTGKPKLTLPRRPGEAQRKPVA